MGLGNMYSLMYSFMQVVLGSISQFLLEGFYIARPVALAEDAVFVAVEREGLPGEHRRCITEQRRYSAEP